VPFSIKNIIFKTNKKNSNHSRNLCKQERDGASRPMALHDRPGYAIIATPTAACAARLLYNVEIICEWFQKIYAQAMKYPAAYSNVGKVK
jgi:hypothetical protein